jgi:hypothetical protein
MQANSNVNHVEVLESLKIAHQMYKRVEHIYDHEFQDIYEQIDERVVYQRFHDDEFGVDVMQFAIQPVLSTK